MDHSPASPGDSLESFARRASSFGSRAAAYAAERPDYPDAAVRWAIEPVASRAPLRVLDLAAGTGKLTASLIRHGAEAAEVGEVVAVEPDEAMFAELRRHLPDVRAMRGSAERIPLGDESVDAIVVGQAMHWFDLDRAFPEMARVLAPGGTLAGLWNMDDGSVPWVRRLAEVSRLSLRHLGGFRTLPPNPYFSSVEATTFPHAQRRTAESMAATIATHSHVLVLPDDERAALMDRVLTHLRSTPETANGEFDLPLLTTALRAVRT